MEYVQIKDIRAGQKNINVVFIVLEAIQSNATTAPGSGTATSSTTAKSGNGGGNGGNVSSAGSGSSSGLPGGSVRYSSSDSTTKTAPTGKSNSRGRGGYRNGGRSDRR
ncbi:hypothetical protein DMN91_009881 [Ooceraea biroi]|uniref:Uncharacterized protein n=1 Tax=Ooceraea biroi TaxID=2015173 RepID=A0A3L8DAW5_OOCBI|nr:hypothetical protein DMN91_009881 [Ooceraea biroi]